MKQHYNSRTSIHRHGTVLLVVLVLVFLLPLAAYTFADLMFAEVEATKFYQQEAESKAAAESGLEYVAAVLADRTETTEIQLYNSLDLFRDKALINLEDAFTTPMFSCVAADIHEKTTSKLRFGLNNESGKLNLNALTKLEKDNYLTEEQTRNFLMFLPNMNEGLADSILDWIDSDSTVRPVGAEEESYTEILPKNAALESLDELLNIPTITPQMLYGEDTNRNGILDDNENDGALTLPADNADGVLDQGWSQYLTLVAKEKNLRADDTARINLNDSSLTTLYDALELEFGAEFADIVVAYRINGPIEEPGSGPTKPTTGDATADSNIEQLANALAGGLKGTSGTQSGSGNSGNNQGGNSTTGGTTPGNSSSSGGSKNNTQGNSTGNNNSSSGSGGSSGSSSGGSTTTRGGMDLSKGGPNTIKSVFDLIDAQVEIEVEGVDTTIISPLTNNSGILNQYLPMFDELTSTGKEEEVIGKVHVLQAQDQVLLGIPGMTQTIIDSIHTKGLQLANGENTATADIDNTIGWLLADGYVDTFTMQQIAPYLTARGDVFTVQVLGYTIETGPATRLEAMIDASKSPPMIMYQRDLTPLGKGFDRASWMNQEEVQP
jgi:hypothetical protein